MNAVRHFLDLVDIPARDLRAMIGASLAMKRGRRERRPLEGRTLAMIFDKPSTRTRISFEVAMMQLGGDVVTLTGKEMQLGRGETIADTARVLSRYVDAIMIRTDHHSKLLELAEAARLTELETHICQILLNALEDLGFLKRQEDGIYWRQSNE